MYLDDKLRLHRNRAFECELGNYAIHDINEEMTENAQDMPVGEDDKLGAWAKRFGEVVYVKQGKYPWWPSCIVDPESLNEKPAVIKRGVSLTGKQYTVYFYNDNTVGFATPANLRPFNADTKAEFATQKFTNKGYEKSYPIAIGLAEQELLLDQDKRLAWCTVTTAPTPAKKRGRQPKAKAAVDVDEVQSSPFPCHCHSLLIRLRWRAAKKRMRNQQRR